nr:hypothetical protein [Sphingopyxis sp. P1IMeth2]
MGDYPQTADHRFLDLGNAYAMALGKLAIAKLLDAVPEKDGTVGRVNAIDGALILTEQVAPRAGVAAHRFLPSQ